MTMGVFVVFLSVALFVGISHGNELDDLLATIPTATSCRYNGKDYPLGSFDPSPCEHCQCTYTGRALCAIADCFFTMCANPVHDPTKCCPQCPDGRTCKAPDGTIIKHGETYRPDANTMCTCDLHSFTNLAQCAIRIVDPVPVHVVDPVPVHVVDPVPVHVVS